MSGRRWVSECLPRREAMSNTQRTLVLAALIPAMTSHASALELQSATLHDWQDYVRSADDRLQMRVANDQPFLWMSEAPERLQAVAHGGILVQPMAERGMVSIRGGLIHHWVGAIFIPHAKLGAVRSVKNDYDSYDDIYKPAVVESKSLGSDGTHDHFSMVWHRQVLFVNAAVQSDYSAYAVRVDSTREYSIADSTRIQQIENYGRPDQRSLAPDTGSGFIWRVHSIQRYEERTDGVYLEIEALALTRDIPKSMRWLVSPVVNRLSVESLTTTLRQTRAAVEACQLKLAGGIRPASETAPLQVVKTPGRCQSR